MRRAHRTRDDKEARGSGFGPEIVGKELGPRRRRRSRGRVRHLLHLTYLREQVRLFRWVGSNWAILSVPSGRHRHFVDGFLAHGSRTSFCKTHQGHANHCATTQSLRPLQVAHEHVLLKYLTLRPHVILFSIPIHDGTSARDMPCLVQIHS